MRRGRLIVVAAVLFLVAGCSTSGPRGAEYDLRPPGSTGVAYTLEDLLTEPDLIVVATFTETRPGRVVGRDATDPEVAFEETTLTVDEVWAGSTEPGETVLVESERDASPFTREWRKEGEKVVASLWLKRDPESAGRFYRPIVPQGIFLVDGDRLVPAADGELAEAAADEGIGGLKAAVFAARSQAGSA